MPVLVFTDGKIYAGGYDLSGDHNEVAVGIDVEEKEFTRMGAEGKSRRAGLGEISVNGGGYVNAGTDLQDEVHFNDLGVYQRIMTLAAIGNVGDRAVTFRGVELEYVPFDAAVGDQHGFSVGAMSTGLFLPSGVVLHDTAAAETVSGSETGQQEGALSATENAYASLHVVAASGTSPTLDVDVESDDNGGFSTPTTRFSFAQATGITSEWSTAIAGPITDDWWRVAWAIGGGTPSFTFIVTFGIK